jgi:hypothetical protein
MTASDSAIFQWRADHPDATLREMTDTLSVGAVRLKKLGITFPKKSGAPRSAGSPSVASQLQESVATDRATDAATDPGLQCILQERNEIIDQLTTKNAELVQKNAELGLIVMDMKPIPGHVLDAIHESVRMLRTLPKRWAHPYFVAKIISDWLGGSP